MAKREKIQALLINYLSEFGAINLTLPDSVQVQIGITQEGKNGLVKKDDYCWIATNRENRSTMLDRYSMSLNFDTDDCCLIYEDAGNVDVI